ncbi:MAG: glucosidase [Cyanobacteria bacterium SZAS LIN-3]|nr:glucosidase [Cyanobacteria bacterium SZAS LIN-3]MBS2008506.1 glucosidase [Cyanobacteria bacterium SZAS TMP-1]
MCDLSENARLGEDEKRLANWKRWGPYLAERQWGTVREDYSADGACWDYFSHDAARMRAYRWGEDGLLGLTDRECRLCFSLALWNERDAILKERLYGLTNSEGNHGEDVKEYYYYLDSTPTHSYMKALYKYPQAAFPYGQLKAENARRGRLLPEYELLDTGVFDDDRYFDVFVEYAKADCDDILIKITATNRGGDAAPLHILPTLWFRNTWSWGRDDDGYAEKPSIREVAPAALMARHATLGDFSFTNLQNCPAIFTENVTNFARLYNLEGGEPYVKDAFHDYVIGKDTAAVNPAKVGTKAAFHHYAVVAPGASSVVRLRLCAAGAGEKAEHAIDETEFDAVFAARKNDADVFYQGVIPHKLSAEAKRVVREAYGGLLWTKQYYHYVVREWLSGDPLQPKPQRNNLRNTEWQNVFNRDVISVPDKWEYPWYAAWDLAFHMVPMAKLDSRFAKDQLLLLLREWYMRHDGQLPAYEFNFSDVNPPVHAWAAFRVYKMSAPRGLRDTTFLERVFHKLLINFTWWVNRKDVLGNDLFGGGFLGLDNIGLFDRSAPLPRGGVLQQADGTAWMAFYCTTMLGIALELAAQQDSYEDVASKFVEHFVQISDAVNKIAGCGLWDEADGFYYDQLVIPGHTKPVALKVRSLVGLIPLLAVEVLDDKVVEKLPGFRKRLEWFIQHRKDLGQNIDVRHCAAGRGRRLLALVDEHRLRSLLKYMLDENEFLSPYGLRSVSRVHAEKPYEFDFDGQNFTVGYEPAESKTGSFGGNSNWRGPVWLPINFLIVEALERYHHYFGDEFKVEFPTGSGNLLNLSQVASEISCRIAHLFMVEGRGEGSGAPWQGRYKAKFQDRHWKDMTLFYEYFNGDDGAGLGASHQTGWTSLITRFMDNLAKAHPED